MDRLLDLRGTYQVRSRHVVHGPAVEFAGLPVIRCFGFDVHEPKPLRRRKIPGGTVKIVFALDGTFEGRRIEPAPLVIGLHDRGGTAEHAGRMRSVQVQLEPLAARRLLGAPLHELRNGTADLGEFLGPSAHELTARLAETTAWTDRFTLVAAALREWTARAADPGDAAVARAVRQLRRSAGVVSFTELADESGWSRRHFRRLFTEDVGLSPKGYGSLMRFSAALTALTAAPEADMSRVASEFGYYDQAHLSRDFQRFAGAPPGRLIG
ncbi:helix-turn-helix domain-containing protein [Nocardia sp. NPDC052566]|uniref:AraC family transcriptional regulator n=1 Tax=Nocardia sp. NPDC052566 TaxID=3364330 RepID=UPI0037C5B928